MNKRKKHSNEFKTKVVLEALKERLTMSELAGKYELHPNQISIWKKHFLDRVGSVFGSPNPRLLGSDSEKEKEGLYGKIGQLQVEVDFLKKNIKINRSTSQRRKMVNKKHMKLSLSKQCELLSLHRSGLYYRPVGESSLNKELKQLLEQKHLETPVYGVPKLYQWLRLDMGYKVSKNRVERLCRDNNIKAIYPKPNLSKPRKGHNKFPYLLGKKEISFSNEVWQTDITYLPMRRGTMYLVAVIDVYSRYVMSWSVSNTMTSDWCCSVVDEAISKYGESEILNTDQGSQFTSDEFVNLVINENSIKLSMNGKGRSLDNIFIERLWRTIKYEHIFLNPAEDGEELRRGIDEYFKWYNNERRHQSLGYKTPSEVYFSSDNAENKLSKKQLRK